MKAIVQDTYGSEDVLELRDVDKPEMADDEVMVRVSAAGLDRWVWHVMAGLPYPIRLAGGLRTPRSAVPGTDLAGRNASLSRLRRALTPKGTHVIVGGEEDGRWLGGSDRQIRALMLSPFVGQKLGTFISSQNHQDLIVLKELIEAGKVTPAIDRTYLLSEAAHAIQYVAQGRARGKGRPHHLTFEPPIHGTISAGTTNRNLEGT
jgi:NADPH:quinone reductase-like Zn-dependent oxidoreductase